MRLPSHSYDPKDLIRHLSVVADGPEEIIEADDYLMPQSQAQSTEDETSGATVTMGARGPKVRNSDRKNNACSPVLFF